MCGVGTYLLALRWAWSRLGRRLELWGADAGAESLKHAQANAEAQGASPRGENPTSACECI